MRAARTSYMEDMTWSAATWQGTPIADRVSPGRPAGGSAGRMLERDARLENGCANSCSCGIASQDIRRWRSRSICEAAAKACTRIHAIRMRNISRRYSVWDLLMIRLENGDVFYRSISRDRQRDYSKTNPRVHARILQPFQSSLLLLEDLPVPPVPLVLTGAVVLTGGSSAAYAALKHSESDFPRRVCASTGGANARTPVC